MVAKVRQTGNNRPSPRVAAGHGDAVCTTTDSAQRTQLTSYQRMQEVLASRSREPAADEISTVDDLLQLLKANPNPEQVVLRLKLLWVSDHSYKQLPYVHLHFIDADASEPLDELLKTFRDNYADNAHDVDSLLFTATIWSINSEDSNLPPPGTVVRISKYSNLGLFRELQSQATIRLTSLIWS